MRLNVDISIGILFVKLYSAIEKRTAMVFAPGWAMRGFCLLVKNKGRESFKIPHENGRACHSLGALQHALNEQHFLLYFHGPKIGATIGDSSYLRTMKWVFIAVVGMLGCEP